MSCSYMNQAVWRQIEARPKGSRAEPQGSPSKGQRLRMGRGAWRVLEKLRMRTIRSLEFAPDQLVFEGWCLFLLLLLLSSST